MIKFWIVFMLLAPDGQVLRVDKQEVSTKAECYGAETERKLPNGSWFLARCGVIMEN